MTYKVTSKYGRGAEIFCKEFGDLKDAQGFIETKLVDDAKMNVKAIYRINDEFNELVKEFDPAKMDLSALLEKSRGSSSDAQGGAGKGASFRPTPLNTSPRPAGTPPKWIRDEEEGKDEDKK